MTYRSLGAAAVFSAAIAAFVSLLSLQAGFAVLLLGLSGAAAGAFAVERRRSNEERFLARLSHELLGCRDVEGVRERATAALGSFLGAKRVATYRGDADGSYRLSTQYAAEDIRPLEPGSSLPVALVELRGRVDRQVAFLGGGAGADRGEDLALAIYGARALETFLAKFHDVARECEEVVKGRIAQTRLSEIRGALLQLAHALASTQELEATLDLAVTASVPLARCHGGAIFLDNGASGFRTAAAYGLADELTPAVFSRLLPKLDEAAAERVPVALEDCEASFLVVPMFHGRELMGVQLLARVRGESSGASRWDEADLEVARVASQLTATGIKNANRLEELIGAASSTAGLASLAFDLHVTLDAQGIILGCNQILIEAVGRSRSELEGRRFEELLDRRSARSFRELLNDLFRRGSLRGEAMGLVDREGEEIAVIVNAHAFSPSSAHLVMKDVTESTGLRLQLQQSQKQEVLGLLASGIAHDLNNVLGGVMGYASLARRQTEDPLLTKYVGTIERTAMRGASLTGRLLSASRKGRVRYEPVSLNHLAEETLEILSHSIPKNITVETRLDPAVPVMMADPGELQQVLLNLSVNARDAMKGGGVLRLMTRLNDGEGTVQLTIEDDGVGMDTTTLERLFEPFYSTKGASGTGLGLSVVYNIVKSLSGEIRVKSSLGKGTRFDVFLPCLLAEEAPEICEGEEPAGAGELVLLVDDEPVMRELGKDILEAQGYRVEAVASGEDAIEFLRRAEEMVALVVLDLVMPGLDGTETYRRLRTLQRGLPVLLSSGLSAEDTVSELLHDRATGFLGKPYGTEELARAVRKAITEAKGATTVVH